MDRKDVVHRESHTQIMCIQEIYLRQNQSQKKCVEKQANETMHYCINSDLDMTRLSIALSNAKILQAKSWSLYNLF